MMTFWLVLGTAAVVLAVLPLLLAAPTIRDISDVWMEGDDDG